jgi:hypothetical protein
MLASGGVDAIIGDIAAAATRNRTAAAAAAAAAAAEGAPTAGAAAAHAAPGAGARQRQMNRLAGVWDLPRARQLFESVACAKALSV